MSSARKYTREERIGIVQRLRPSWYTTKQGDPIWFHWSEADPVTTRSRS